MPHYEFPFYHLYRNGENFLVMSPRVYGNPAGVKAFAALFLFFAEVWFSIEFTPFLGSPLEYQAMWSLDRKDHYC